MAVWHRSEMGTIGSLGQKLTTWKRPLLVGTFAAGVIALGASTAMAATPLGSPSPGPSTVWGQHTSTSMMSGTSMGIMLGTSDSMMSGTGMGIMPRACDSMMSHTSASTPPTAIKGTGTLMMTGTRTGRSMMS